MPLSRKKSCVGCRHSKARCDLAVPSCSRCRLRNHDCVYEGEARVAPLDWPPTVAESSHAMVFDDTPRDQSVGLTSTLVLDPPSIDLDWLQEGSGLGDAMKFLAPPSLSLPFGDGLQLETSDSLILTDPLIPDSLPTPSPIPSIDQGQVQRLSSEQRPALQRRQILKNCVLTSIVVGQMTSYPKMMIEGDVLPPFISPPCFVKEHMAPDCADHGYHRCLPEHLSVCSSLVRMYYERTSANASFVWKSIYAECAKLHSEFPKYETDRQLSVIQAIMVYTLLQVDDAPSAEENGATQLLKILTEMAYAMSQTIVWQGEIPRNRPDRADWIYSESLSRVVMMLSVLDLLLDGVRPLTDRVPTSCGSFCAFPLPCHRDLWLARSNRAWRAAYDRVLSSRKGTKLLTAGELVQYDSLGLLSDVQVGDEIPPDVLDIARWAEGLDALGTLVWMVLPFQKWRRNELESSW